MIEYNVGDKVIAIDSGLVGEVYYIYKEAADDWYYVSVGKLSHVYGYNELAPVIEQPELEAMLEEREYKRFWLNFKVYPLGLGAIVSYMIGIFFLLENSYPFYTNYLAGFVLIATAIGLGLLVSKNVKDIEFDIKHDEL